VTSASARPAAVVVGGSHNALSIARSLGRRGIRVFALNGGHAEIRWSRYATSLPLPAGVPYETALRQFLCGPDAAFLAGAVLLAAGDEGLKLFSERHEELATRFRLDLCHPPAQRAMLEKLSTYEAASAAGVATPRYCANWISRSRPRSRRMCTLIM